MTEDIRDLLTVRRLSYEIWRKELRLEEIRSTLLPKAITYDGDRVQTSPEDRMSEVMAKVVDLDAQIRQLKEKKAMAILALGDDIDRVDDERCRAVLDAYYIAGQRMTDIAESMAYSRQHVYKLRRAGVEKMRQMRQSDMVV